ncbi:hypothetical protein [Beijerinckia sp. L45]|uniref:hypothetical protein n=1 Tax=Beijerinckia sp. L45 TaxID=1641855 RepID=UPI00131B9EE2|nr:hypothetical protein [Beijerinckia sp. L45]
MSATDQTLKACADAVRIKLEPIAPDLVLVRLPTCFWAYRELRTRFRRARPAAEVYTMLLRGTTALPRLAKWVADAEPRVIAEVVAKEQKRRDAEWEDA